MQMMMKDNQDVSQVDVYHKRAEFIFEVAVNPKNVFDAQLCHGIDSRVSDRFGIYGKHLKGQFCFKTTI